MLLCFGSRRRARHDQIRWNEKEHLLDDEPQMIPNPCFLDTGKGQHNEPWELNMSCQGILAFFLVMPNTLPSICVGVVSVHAKMWSTGFPGTIPQIFSIVSTLTLFSLLIRTHKNAPRNNSSISTCTCWKCYEMAKTLIQTNLHWCLCGGFFPSTRGKIVFSY